MPARSKGILVVVGLLLVGGTAFVLSDLGAHEGAAPLPEGLTAALRATDFRWPAEPPSEYRRLGTPFSGGAGFHAVAIGEDGTLALGMTGARVLVFRAGRFEVHRLPQGRAVSALAVAPGGAVYVGLLDGTFARIGAEKGMGPRATVAAGYSIVGFAFDRQSDRGALMLAGGEVRTGKRPLAVSRLHTVPMPKDARIRHLTYDGDGRLVVAGDRGAVFIATDDGWDARELPSDDAVVALGVDTSGALVVADQAGKVFRSPGSTWELLGAIGGTPVALGPLAGYDLAVTTEKGSVYVPTGDGAFVQPEGHDPGPHMRATAGAVLGHNAAVVGGDRAVVFDGQVWSTRPEGEDPQPAPTECMAELLDRAVGEGVVALFECRGRNYATLGDGQLERTSRVTLQSGPVAASKLAHALRIARDRNGLWVDGTLVVPAAPDRLPGVERWDPKTGRFVLALPRPVDEGPIRALDVFARGEEREVWTVSQTGRVRFSALGQAPGGESALVASHADFEARYGEGFLAPAVRVRALGAGRALVTHVGVGSAVVHKDGGVAPEPVEDANALLGTEARPFVAAVGGADGPRLVRCAGGPCAEVALPAYATPRRAFPVDEGWLIEEANGAFGLLPAASP